MKALKEFNKTVLSVFSFFMLANKADSNRTQCDSIDDALDMDVAAKKQQMWVPYTYSIWQHKRFKQSPQFQGHSCLTKCEHFPESCH